MSALLRSVLRWSLVYTFVFGFLLLGAGKPEWALPFLGGSLLMVADVWANALIFGLFFRGSRGWAGGLMVGKYLLLFGVIYWLVRETLRTGASVVALACGVLVFPGVVLLKALGMMVERRRQPRGPN